MATRLIFFALCFFPSGAFSTELKSLSWGFHNTGVAQRILIDHYTTGLIEGIAGEDIQPLAGIDRERKPIIVAVLDTGVDESHPSLEGALVSPGFNAIDGSNQVRDTHGHGTHISGIIAGRPNGSGFHGVSSSAKILPIRVIQSAPNAPIRPQEVDSLPGTALTDNVAKAILHAINRGAQIIHLSLAWPATIRNSTLDAAIESAHRMNTLIVASAGNDSTESPVYPCSYSHVICVGAHGPDGAFTHFSNHGPMVDLLAPGISILSSWPISKPPNTLAGQVGYELRNGTSMAAPFVTGALAELLSLGFSPEESVNRILLSARPTQKRSLFRSELAGSGFRSIDFSQRTSRFGNLDLKRAYMLNPQPLIVPESKAPLRIEWRGSSLSEPLSISWVNRWADADRVTIRILNQDFRFKKITKGERVSVRIDYPVSNRSESLDRIRADVLIEGYPNRTFFIPITLVRVIEKDSLPKGSSIHATGDFSVDTSMSIRSITAVGPVNTQSHLFLRDDPEGTFIRIVRAGHQTQTLTLKGVNSNQLMNWYLLPDQSYYAIFLLTSPNGSRPQFHLYRIDGDGKIQSDLSLDSSVAILPENLKFLRLKDSYAPHFIAHGWTPKPDLPPFDPWNPEWRDQKRLRLYFLGEDGIRTVRLPEELTPLFLLPGGRVLTSEGSGYRQTYALHQLHHGQVIEKTPLGLPRYRMLAGLIEAPTPVSLENELTDSTHVYGRSSPGSLRLSMIHPNAGEDDKVLDRPSALDSLVSVLGIFKSGENAGVFAESLYELYFFPEKKGPTLSTSLNRYSYLPSMIFTRGFFPLRVRDQNRDPLPALYSPASEMNEFISEILVADSIAGKIRRPLGLRWKAGRGCNAIGNPEVKPAPSPAQAFFLCGQNLISIPLTIAE